MASTAFKYRLYPTVEQEILFRKTFGCCRKVYNLMLADKIASYQDTGKFKAVTPAEYKTDYPFLKEVDSLALANTQLHLQQAFKNHFDKKRKKRTRFPHFKSAKHSRKSYTTNNQHGTIELQDKGIKLPKVGWVKTVIHRTPESDWKLKSATISQDSDGSYYVSVLFEYETVQTDYKIDINNAIGLDYSAQALYVDNHGHTGSNHQYYRESQDKLAKAQRTLARKQGGRKGETKSKNYVKHLRKVNRIHTHIANQRRDNLHKRSTEIANQYDIVCVETLNMTSIGNKRGKHGKSTYDNGYGMFLNMLEYKLKKRGKVLVRVDKWFPSSQTCSGCGVKHPEMKNLSNRIMTCACGLVLDRDQNAAINILREGQKQLQASR